MRDITYSRDALRTLLRLPANTAALIRSKIALYAADSGALGNNVKALKGQPGIRRLRVGDGRVILSEDGAVVAIIRIAARGNAYD
ncbi:type II toxin-antitoxin system RelE family toxin [Methylobacterium segetis]|uniref:type II toxin-antitoxin system RelE family toxin n=1 Tax=Methylobacterium segetis TaxID=2488750 RepID=UPI00104311BC|nr:type II toxin-antitoxin system RelE/ParE family toxin [Methylobacterium segetis]